MNIDDSYNAFIADGGVPPNMIVINLSSLAKLISVNTGIPYECARCIINVRIDDEVGIDTSSLFPRYAPGQGA